MFSDVFHSAYAEFQGDSMAAARLAAGFKQLSMSLHAIVRSLLGKRKQMLPSQSKDIDTALLVIKSLRHGFSEWGPATQGSTALAGAIW